MTCQFFNADALDVLAALPKASVDILATDPPYSSGGKHRAKREATGRKYCTNSRAPEFAGETMDQRSYFRFTAQWLKAAKPALKPGAPVAIFTDWRQLPVVSDALQIAGYHWNGVAVWDKTEGTRPQPAAYRQQGEFIVWGTNGRKPTKGPILPGVFRAANVTRDKLHQTQKPVSVMEWVISLAPEGGVVCDPFAGSGTTGIAALNTGRKFIGCEAVHEIFCIAHARLEIHQNQWTA